MILSLSLSATLFLVGAAAQPAGRPDDVIGALVRAQEATRRGDMAAADSLSRAIIARWPDDPTGYYALAALAEIRSLGCHREGSKSEIERDLDRAISAGRRRLSESPGEVWGRYIVGLALGLKAVRAVREGSLWRAYRLASRSVNELEAVLRSDPAFADAWLPIGAYHFWRGEALKRWTWLPFIEDTREQGLREMRRAAVRGRTTRVSARIMLIWALLEYHDYDEALLMAGPLVEKYPANRSVLWAQAEAYKALGRWREAERAFTLTLATFGSDTAGCAGPVEIRAKRGMALAELGECARAEPLLRAALAYEPASPVRGFDEVRKEAKHYLARCAEEHGRKQ